MDLPSLHRAKVTLRWRKNLRQVWRRLVWPMLLTHRGQHTQKAVAHCDIPPASQMSSAASCCLIFLLFFQSTSSITTAKSQHWLPPFCPYPPHLESALSPDFEVRLQVQVKGTAWCYTSALALVAQRGCKGFTTAFIFPPCSSAYLHCSHYHWKMLR